MMVLEVILGLVVGFWGILKLRGGRNQPEEVDILGKKRGALRWELDKLDTRRTANGLRIFLREAFKA